MKRSSDDVFPAKRRGALADTGTSSLVTRPVLVIAAIAGMALGAVVGAAERGHSPGDLESPSAHVIAVPPRIAEGPGVANPAAVPRNVSVLEGMLSGASPFKESARRMAVSTGLADLNKRTFGPYSDIAARIADAVYEAVLPSSRSGTLHWPLLVLRT